MINKRRTDYVIDDFARAEGEIGAEFGTLEFDFVSTETCHRSSGENSMPGAIFELFELDLYRVRSCVTVRYDPDPQVVTEGQAGTEAGAEAEAEAEAEGQDGFANFDSSKLEPEVEPEPEVKPELEENASPEEMASRVFQKYLVQHPPVSTWVTFQFRASQFDSN